MPQLSPNESCLRGDEYEVTGYAFWYLLVQCDLPESLRLPLLLILGRETKLLLITIFGVFNQSRPRPQIDHDASRAPVSFPGSEASSVLEPGAHVSGEAGARFLANPAAFSWILNFVKLTPGKSVVGVG